MTTAAPARPREPFSLVLHLPPALRLGDDELLDLCQRNNELNIERTAAGELIIMSPTGGETSNRNAALSGQLYFWAKRNGTGTSFDSNGGFDLPNGATRAPDASWVLKSRLATLAPAQKRQFLPLCPDFVMELRSPSDDLSVVQAKMREYIDNGACLGLLIDPTTRKVQVYRPDTADPIVLDDPATVSCDPELPGFVLEMADIFQPGF